MSLDRKALIIGINYLYSGIQLAGCIADAKKLALWLELYRGFSKEDILVLTDDNPIDSINRPNYSNIIASIDWLLRDTTENSVRFFSFSGHGSYIYDYTSHEITDKMNVIHVLKREVINVFAPEIQNKFKRAAGKIICLMDCCHSGSFFHLKYKINGTCSINDQVTDDTNSKLISICSCHDDETTLDDESGGILTRFFLKYCTIQDTANPAELALFLSSNITCCHPTIHCSHIELISKPIFSLTDNVRRRYSLFGALPM